MKAKKIFSTLFLLCLITFTVSIQANASEDINETLMQGKMCDIESKKKLHIKEIDDGSNKLKYVYDESGREIYYFGNLLLGFYQDEMYNTYDSFGKLQSSYGYSDRAAYRDINGSYYVYHDNQKLNYIMSHSVKDIRGSSLMSEQTIIFINEFGQSSGRFVVDENGNEIRRSIVEYDSNRNIILIQVYEKGEETGREVYEYDSNGNILLRQLYEKGEEIRREVYEYDSNGNILLNEMHQVYEKGEEIRREIDKYDSNGNIVMSQVYEKREETWREVYEYDSNGNILLRQLYEKGNEPLQEVYKYDSNGNVIEKAVIRNGNVNKGGYYQYTYNENGDILSESYCGDMIIFETKYGYNQNGDILSKVEIRYEFRNGGWATSYYTEKKYEYDQDGDIVAEYSRNSLESDFTKVATYTYYPE